MSIEKILKIVISEIVETILFITVIKFFDGTPSISSYTSMIYAIWALFGIGTPFVIWYELEEELGKLIKAVSR